MFKSLTGRDATPEEIEELCQEEMVTDGLDP